MAMNKYIKYVKNKLIILKNEKRFVENGNSFRYMLFTDFSSDTLIIVFSSCTKIGVPARYHYIQTLKNVSANKLFILDDKADDHRGGYYIGSDMKFNDELTVTALINKSIEDTKAKQLIFIGSSKGGYAALNYGLEYDSSVMIVGAPQYNLGDYLNNIEGDKSTLRYIIGNDLKLSNIQILNARLKDKLLENTHENQMIYMHFSNREETFHDHVLPLITDLEKTKIHVICDVENYGTHAELGNHYPGFLLSVLKKIGI